MGFVRNHGLVAISWRRVNSFVIIAMAMLHMAMAPGAMAMLHIDWRPLPHSRRPRSRCAHRSCGWLRFDTAPSCSTCRWAASGTGKSTRRCVDRLVGRHSGLAGMAHAVVAYWRSRAPGHA